MTATARRRRWAGVISLGVAILMVVAGDFFLPATLPPLVQIGYWFVCFLFTTAAILIAVVDLLAVRQATRQETRNLLDRALRDLEANGRNGDHEGPGR